jgi:tetratricopeptide (TPR) repeat protein
MPLKSWHVVPAMRVSSPLHDLPGRKYWRLVRQTGSAEGEVEAHNQIAEYSQLLGDHTTAVSSLKKAAELRQRTGSALQAARQWFALGSYLTYRFRVFRDELAALALARQAAEEAEHVGLLSEILVWEGFTFAMMGKHDEARARVDSSLQLALDNNLPMQAAIAYRVLGDLREFRAALLRKISRDQFARRAVLIGSPCGRSSATRRLQRVEARRGYHIGCAPGGTFRRRTCSG